MSHQDKKFASAANVLKHLWQTHSWKSISPLFMHCCRPADFWAKWAFCTDGGSDTVWHCIGDTFLTFAAGYFVHYCYRYCWYFCTEDKRHHGHQDTLYRQSILLTISCEKCQNRRPISRTTKIPWSAINPYNVNRWRILLFTVVNELPGNGNYRANHCL